MEKFFKPKNLIKNILLIDGLGRSGKTALVQILPSLRKTEHIDYLYGLEQILAGISLGHITHNFGKAYITLMLNEYGYNKLIARGSNFRKDDWTGVPNSYRYKEYKKRLFKKDGDKIVDKLKNYSDTFLFCTHNTMASYDVFKKMKINHKIVQVFRNPVDNIYSWYTRGWGKRFGKDPRAFTISIDHKLNSGPWHLFERKNQWFQSNEVEKCVIGAITLIKRSIKMEKKYYHKNILNIKFEHLAENTDYVVRGISNFLGTVLTDQTKKKYKFAKMPRKIDIQHRDFKRREIKKNISKKLFIELEELEGHYQKNYGLKFFK